MYPASIIWLCKAQRGRTGATAPQGPCMAASSAWPSRLGALRPAETKHPRFTNELLRSRGHRTSPEAVLLTALAVAGFNASLGSATRVAAELAAGGAHAQRLPVSLCSSWERFLRT